MKYILSLVGVGIIICAIFLCGGKRNEVNQDYLRIHISANSNSAQDQNVKYVVKDAVVDFLIPYLADATTKDEAMKIVQVNLNKIEEVANQALMAEGVSYGATIRLSEEEVPARAYSNLVLESGIYDCLEIELGNAQGDNWWCVVFPAVCFLSSENLENCEYISKIWEIINSVTNK